MKNAADWQVPKWPFLSANAALLVVAAVVIYRAAHPISSAEIFIATASVALGAVFGCLPFILEYRATAKLIEVNALTTVAAQLHGLEAYAAQIAAATEQWSRVQETTQFGAEKTATAAKEIVDRMTAEIQNFNDFQARINEGEKGALRLEVDKLRRAEGDWLQVVARMLDHVFALHNAAARSGQPELAEQVGNFQNACRDAARRVGVMLFEAAAGSALDPERHRVHGVENPPAEGEIAETLAPGLTFQGRLIRPALVRLRENNSAPEISEEKEIVAEKIATAEDSKTDSGELSL
jgi:molecular chaperone GrpE (heat shock protein)